MCRCEYPTVCILLCVCSCFINLLPQFNFHWIINIWRKLNSEDFHRVNTLNLRAEVYSLLLCKQFQAVKYILGLPNTGLDTYWLISPSSQTGHRYLFQSRMAYSYHLPMTKPIIFPTRPDTNQHSRQMLHSESILTNQLPLLRTITQHFCHLIFPEEWGTALILLCIPLEKLLKYSGEHESNLLLPPHLFPSQGCLPQITLANKIFTFMAKSQTSVTEFTTSRCSC